jgi:hypothetical protein
MQAWNFFDNLAYVKITASTDELAVCVQAGTTDEAKWSRDEQVGTQAACAPTSLSSWRLVTSLVEALFLWTDRKLEETV